jgi:hypothetical protein
MDAQTGYSAFPKEFSQEPRKPHGCFFYGCITAIVVTVVLLILIGISVYMFTRYMGHLRDDYTDTAPAKLPKVELPKPELDAFKKRLEAFQDALKTGKPSEPLVLTAEDINGWIESQDDYRGKFFVEIPGDKIKGQVSLPLGELGVRFLAGRYLNGTATFKVSLQDGQFVVIPEAVKVKGRPLPDWLRGSIERKNLFENRSQDPDMQEAASQLESIVVKDGKIIVKAKEKPKEEAKDAEKPTPDELRKEAPAKAQEKVDKGAETSKKEPESR